VATALEATGLPSELLIFEITETMVMEDLSGAREVMKKLNGLGVRLAIDDFGTGHSSLAYLKQFPVHEVKVDRAFIVASRLPRPPDGPGMPGLGRTFRRLVVREQVDAGPDRVVQVDR
jgi:predicted signal transduction protein with EAL and GGDEF domain